MTLGANVKGGEEVCTLGFADRRGAGHDKAALTITRGGVSTMPGPEDKNPEIQTDCRIAPGTLGGPLCNQWGAVVGMVHKRAQARQGVDTFALVVPADVLKKFIKEHLPPPAALGRGSDPPATR